MRAGGTSLPGGDTALPVHGFVLAGGQSSRMGRDKALLRLNGVALVEIAVKRLRDFCAEVSLVGNREDLAGFAPVIPEKRLGTGPGAGIEAGLAAAMQSWVLFTPVDVPFVPASLLRGWTTAVLARAGTGCQASFLRVGEDRQPAFALVKKGGRATLSEALDAGERRVAALLGTVGSAAGGDVWVPDAALFAGGAGEPELRGWFRNLNTPGDFAAAEGELSR